MKAASELASRYRVWHRTLRERYLRSYVFVHINKTGGSSIEKALGIRLDHSTALEKHRELGDKAWARKYKFTIVRNPWDKVVSHYHYRVLTNQTGLADKKISFDEWLQECYVHHNPEFYDQPKMFQPQKQWLADEQGTLMVDYVGRFERLNEDFKTICQSLGTDLSLGHKKKSQRSNYRDYYSDASRDLITDVFNDDLQLFGYEF